MKAIKPLPSSLYEALRALETRSRLLAARRRVDDGQIAEWIKVKSEEYYGVNSLFV